MTQEMFESIYAARKTINGVEIVTMPFQKKGAIAVREGDDRFVFISGKLSAEKRQSLIQWGLKWHKKNHE